jgi:GNAT superfamily N-acetyltransferase
MSDKTKLCPPVLLDKSHDRSLFDCGVDALNNYLRRFALQNQERGAARTYVATRGTRVVGYHTLAYGSASPDEVPQRIKKNLAKHPIPLMNLARLAVDVTEHGGGMGKGLLKDALLRTLQAANIAGLRAMLVQAEDDSARGFYQHFGFEPSEFDPYHLYLRIDDIRASI